VIIQFKTSTAPKQLQLPTEFYYLKAYNQIV